VASHGVQVIQRTLTETTWPLIEIQAKFAELRDSVQALRSEIARFPG
jgi:hypothetical protein